MSNKLKDLIVLLDKERAKVRQLEQEVQRLRNMAMHALVEAHDTKEEDENISGRF
jgi:hypothetical protein